MLRQKIDWEKVPWLMTKVKVSEEYYVNYWRHRPFQREWEGEGKPGSERKKGLQSRCHQDTGPQAPISCHLSSAQTSSPHFLFGLHDVTKEEKKPVNISMNTAQKRGASMQRLKSGSKTGTQRQPWCSYVSPWGSGSQSIPSVIWCQNRDSDRQGQGVSLCLIPRCCLCMPLVRHTLHPCTTLPAQQSGPAPTAPLPRQIFNPIHAHAHSGQKEKAWTDLTSTKVFPGKPFLTVDTATHGGSWPHSHEVPAHPISGQNLAKACHKIPQGFNESTVQINLYWGKICLASHSLSFWHRTTPGFHILKEWCS